MFALWSTSTLASKLMRRAGLALLAASCVLLASCDDGDSRPAPVRTSEWVVNDWEPASPGSARVNGNVLVIPAPPKSANYITKVAKPLDATDVIRFRFTLDGTVKPAKDPDAPALATLYFQRRGDNWSASGQYETYRWYASFATVQLTGPGTYEIEAPLSARWTAVLTSNSVDQAAAFADAMANVESVGFVLGGGDGLGHGVTGPATLTIHSFTIEPRLPG